MRQQVYIKFTSTEVALEVAKLIVRVVDTDNLSICAKGAIAVPRYVWATYIKGLDGLMCYMGYVPYILRCGIAGSAMGHDAE